MSDRSSRDGRVDDHTIPANHVDGIHDLLRVVLLEQVTVGSRLQRSGCGGIGGVGGEEEHMDLGQGGLELTTDLMPAGIGQPVVKQDDVGAQPARFSEGFFS